ncbi:PH domain-containing protein [Niabella sp.]|uniref:PH domain-containing protein n=1 Tax=Niabella sp. TaxID=1962976 RepID=UPI002639D26A|nr:PH domain-containing protein [Niabella sp.]
MKFSASYDLSTKIITASVTLLLLTVLGITGIYEKAVRGFPLVLLLLICILTLVLSFGLSVKKYRISNEKLTICRPFGNKRIPLTTLVSAKVIDPKLLRWSWRIFGSGGMFGYYGIFGNKQLGTMKWYMTRKDKAVLLETVNHKKIALSPDDPDGFVNTYQMLSGRS